MKRFYVLIAILFVYRIVIAQNTDMEIGYVQTTLEKNAVNFAVDYAEKLQPNLELFKPGNRSLISFTPDLEILLGSNDAFNGITAKYVGNIMRFDTTTIAGIPGIPNLGKTFHNFPVALGFESDQSFTFINGLAEVGYVPWYQNDTTINSFIRQTKIGMFLQGGYKFSLNDSLQVIGGAKDESNEIPDGNIFRVKLVIGFSPTFYFNKKKELGLSIIGNSITWYDFINKEIYYKLEGKIRFLIKKDYYFDFGYEKGSGAPNFNQGEQFTTNLGIRF